MEVPQLVSFVERKNPGDELSLDAPVSDPVGPINRGVLNSVNRNAAHVVHQYPLVAAEAAVATEVLCNPTHTPSDNPLIIAVDHPQRGLELEFPAGSTHVRVLAFKVPCHFLELRFGSDGAQMSETETQRSAGR